MKAEGDKNNKTKNDGGRSRAAAREVDEVPVKIKIARASAQKVAVRVEKPAWRQFLQY